MFKIGQNCGKIANYPPMLNINRHPWSELRSLQRIEEAIHYFRRCVALRFLKSLNIEPLLLRIKRSQPIWVGRVSRMSSIQAKYGMAM